MSLRFRRTPSTPGNSGFTLVVVAALFIAFAVVAAVAVERNSTLQLIGRRDRATAQLTRLSNAIIEYAVFNKNGNTLLYPCPARTDLATTDTNFGASVNAAGVQNCNTTNYAGVSVLGGSTIIRGMVPIQTLSPYGLGLNDAFDPWNNRIFYVVNRKLTKGATPVVAVEQTNNPSVTDAKTAEAIPAPDFLLISPGRDGLGATRRESTSVAIPCTDGTATLRFENCDNDTSFVISPTFTGATATAATYFDDILAFYRQ
ncbi:MAG: hypothetical protein SFW64_08945 [Alphaproteobacteria bacterium]|nr:hypothetical protein [Alphaproteobacteria bacterium]